MYATTVDLPEPLDAFIREQVASGAYADPPEVVLASVRRFEAQAEADAARLERFEAAVQVGLDQFARGEVVRVDDLHAFFDEIEAEIVLDDRMDLEAVRG